MIKINKKKKGDEVISLNEKFLAVKRKNGTVDVYNILFNESGEMGIDPVKMAEIGFGEGLVEKTMEDGETKVFTF